MGPAAGPWPQNSAPWKLDRGNILWHEGVRGSVATLTPQVCQCQVQSIPPCVHPHPEAPAWMPARYVHLSIGVRYI